MAGKSKSTKKSTKAKTNISKPLKQAVKQIADRLDKQKMERKFHDVSSTAVGVNYSWSYTKLSDVSQGDTDVTRDGDAIMPTSLEFNYQLICGDTTNIFRILIVRCKLGDTTSDYFAVNNSTLAPLSPFVHDTRSDFEVLYDSTHNLDSVSHNSITKRVMLKLAPSKQIQFTGGTTTYGKNGLYLLLCSDSSAVAHPTISYYSRLNFLDP